MAGVVHGWAMMALKDDPIPTLDMMIAYEEVDWALSQEPKEVVKSLGLIGDKGEISAATHGYGQLVASMMQHFQPEVSAAAIEALGKMGLVGMEHAPEITTYLSSLGSTKEVRIAAATAVGNLGERMSEYTQLLMSVASDSQDELVKIAAILAAGRISGRGDQALVSKFSELLNSNSPQISAAACVALGCVGDETHGAAIAAKLRNGETKYGALTGLFKLPGSVVHKYATEIIDTCLTDQDGLTRELACKALGRSDSEGKALVFADDQIKKSVMGKLDQLVISDDAAVRCAAAQALGHMGKEAESFASCLAPLLSDESEDLSWRSLQIGGGAPRPPPEHRKPMCAALCAMGMSGATEYIADITKKLEDDNWEVRVCALEALGCLGEEGQKEAESIASLLKDDVYLVRIKACEVIARIQAEDGASELVPLFKDKSPSVRLAAVKALGALGEGGAPYSNDVFKLIALPDASLAVRAAAITALGNMGERGQCYASVIASKLEDEHAEVRAASADALGKLGEYGAAFAEELAQILYDPSPPVRAATFKALEQMGEEADPFREFMSQVMSDPYIQEGREKSGLIDLSAFEAQSQRALTDA